MLVRALVPAIVAAASVLAGCTGGNTPSSSSASPAATATQDNGRATVGDEWPTYNGNLQGTRFSTLTQITPENVAQLKQVCSLKLESGALQAQPLVTGGTMYVSTAHFTYAIDPTTCALKWSAQDTPKEHEPFPVDRGVAVEDNRVFRGTTDGRLIALDAVSGKSLWESRIGHGGRGEFASAAPIVWQGVVYMGIAGSDWGVKGRMMAFDAATGAVKWTFTTIASGNDPNAKSWPDDTARQRGGGATWTSYTLDPASSTLYVPVANPAPDFVASIRRGANLYTDSIIALDAMTGKLKWYVQMIPHDVHDWDMSAPPVFFRGANGKLMLGAAAKDGVLYGIDVATHKIVYRQPQVRQSNGNEAPTVQGRHFCPGVLGGAEWSGPAYDERNELLITPMDDWCATVTLGSTRYLPGQFYMGGSYKQDDFKQARGELTATDPVTGAVKWQYHSTTPMLAGTTPTASGITLTGDMGGNVLILDSANGKVLATFPTQGSIAGGVITYAIGGKQYVAATSGNISRLTWGNHGTPTILVYAL